MSTTRTVRGRPATPSERVRDVVNGFAARSPSRFAILVFALLILVFTLLFSLPISSANGQWTGLADSLFTAMSVICVTGLSTVDMATHWSYFGHFLVYIGVQVGAVGVLTMASILGLVVSRKLGLRAKLMAAGDSNPLRVHGGPVDEGQAVRLGDVGKLLTTVALSMVVIEGAVALLLFPRMLIAGIDVGTAVWESLYYSAMAFTNTGFTPNTEGIDAFATDYWFLSALMIGVFLGAIGFPVILAIASNLRLKRRRWSIHVKLTLLTSLILLVAGAVLYIVLEYDNPKTFGRLDAGHTIFQSLFLSTMARSGGFSTIPIDDLHGSSLLVTDMLMFIGGGSASTAGGIKVTTLAVLFLAAFAEARGVEPMDAFRRRIPTDVLRVSVAIALWGATIVAVSTILITQITKAPLDHVLFDVISGFATCGLTTGLTERLPDAGIYIMAATMFCGRVGTVTLAAALAQRQRRQLYQNPEERPLVG
ncbi:potassium transporter TrkG [Leifsonia shinshuensis]|uniref:TrkH family potassium uptake protein n=1 Tax=Leifsonia shinshuensis TaxID=150026 RepID=UPI002856F784|nr:potassium transporter TrkG [Leifsonia shinshuensis]MDR6972652.1 Trk-type K+ transport system membrane component [Leifsonia shinshuensis]